jgi:hypothetical protein
MTNDYGFTRDSVQSLRPSAYLGGLCVNAYFTAERAEITQRNAEKKIWLRLCCAAYLGDLCRK